MKFQLSLVAIIVGLSTFTWEARAGCSMGDFVCEKFSQKAAKRAAVRRKARPKRRYKKRRRSTASVREPSNPVKVVPITPSLVKTSMTNEIIASKPAAELIRLQSGAITEAPKQLLSLVFNSNDRIEVATAKCSPAELSKRRIACSVAVHQLALSSAAGSGCTGTLGLRQMEFVKNERGNWINEDSITLCGGRLLRRTELFPVALNGTPSYALREEYQMLGGDQACAAPYLRSRRPLRKAYMPIGNNQSRGLICGIVAAR